MLASLSISSATFLSNLLLLLVQKPSVTSLKINVVTTTALILSYFNGVRSDTNKVYAILQYLNMNKIKLSRSTQEAALITAKLCEGSVKHPMILLQRSERYIQMGN